MAQQLKVFVSHSHTDNAFCAELVKALQSAGADVWYDNESLHTGQLGPVIEHELRERPVFIVVLSPAALASRWVEDEARWAYNRHRKDPSRIMLPVLAETLPNEDDIWLFMQDFRRTGATGGGPFSQPEAIARTLHALALTPGAATRATPAPAPTPQLAESVGELLSQGKALVAQKKYAEAIPFLERATQRDPRSFDAWANLGLSYMECDRDVDALAAYDRALVLDDKQAWVWSNKAMALGKVGRPKDSLEACERALGLDPKLANALNHKGNALDDLKRSVEALACHDRALALDPKYVHAWVGRGNSLLDLKRYDEALDAYDRALALAPKLSGAWAGKWLTLRGMGRTAEAEQVDKRARELGCHW